MINLAIGMLIGVAFVACLLIVKAQLRCRHCSVKDQTIGAQAGIVAQMKKEIEYLKDLLGRALVKQGTIAEDPAKLPAPAPAPEDPAALKEREQVEKAIKSGGEAFGVDE